MDYPIPIGCDGRVRSPGARDRSRVPARSPGSPAALARGVRRSPVTAGRPAAGPLLVPGEERRGRVRRPVLSRRRHIDLLRTSSALCRAR
ncbi:putative leader peptide [Geodermatophilus sp. URMC 62]|uniref:putative leader peptide n=1 Tax=Geodermatophilus sp. URMC 62 TaxID=3423414 RepID=UPI00406C3225